MPAVPDASARLVVLGPAALQGRSVAVGRGPVLIGRDPASSLVLDDPYVSRRHAALRRVGPDLLLEDLGSASGTRLNDQRLSGPARVRPGDVIGLARVSLRYEEPASASGETRTYEAVPPVAAAPADGTPRFDVGAQHAVDINMAGRDQYNYQQHVLQLQHVQQVRDSFLREVAAAKSKARALIWTGLLVMVAGFVLYGVVFARAAGAIGKGLSDAFRAGPGEIPQPPDVQIFGPDVAGVPLAVAGLFLASAGVLLLVVGVVLHVTAAARGRKVDQRHPLPYAAPVPYPYPQAYPQPYPPGSRPS
jgi:FHA domain